MDQFGSGIKRPTLKHDLQRLVAAGLVQKRGTGKSVVYFYSSFTDRRDREVVGGQKH